MLTIATLSANTFKKALEVTSHNVANVSTEGYSRQRAEFSSNTPTVSGNSFQGAGSSVSSVERVYAQYIQEQLYTSSGLVDRFDSQLGLSKQVEGIVASNDQGVQEFMQSFFDALQTVSNNPTSSTSGQVLLDEAGNLEGHIGNLSTVLDDIHYQTNNQIKDITIEVNDRLEMIQDINERIEYAFNNSSNPPNDLLDQRDQAILEISEFIDIKTYYHEDGGVDVYTGNGRLPLLSGNTLTRLEADISEYPDENRIELYMSVGGQRTQISDYISGGQMGGVLDFRNNMLDQAQQDLGLTLNAMTASMNWQHYQGYDLEGNAGGNIFEPLSIVGAMSHADNTENGDAIAVSFNPLHAPFSQPATYGEKQANLNTAIAEIGQFAARDYEIRADGTSYTFHDSKTGELLTPVETAVGSNVFQLDGLEFDLSGQASNVDGDSFLIKPHSEMLEQFKSVITDTNQIATRGQSPVPATLDNDGDGDIDLDDRAPAAAAYGDNVNIANMASLQSKKILFSDGSGLPSENLLGGYSKMATNVGTYVRGTEIQLNAQTNVHDQMVAQRESYSGVSLDEEAANLIKYQQAYEASAQIIATYQQLFQTLLSVARG